jgi:hypothetical protein
MAVTADAPPLAPRPFRLRAIDAVSVFLLLFGGIWAVVDVPVVIGLSVAGGPFWNDLILDRRGIAVVATIDSVQRTQTRVNGRYVNRIACTFFDAAGATHATSALTTNLAFIGARATTPILIEYDPQSPGRARVQGERASMLGALIFIPLGMGLVGGVLFALGLRRVRALRDIYVHGQAVQATVSAVAPTLMRVNGQRVMRVDYSFDTITGKMRGRTSTRRPPPVGAPLWVLYDASDPKRSVAA